MNTPDDRRYRASHEWAQRDGARARVGISEYAQGELGDVVYVELPAIGAKVKAGEPLGVIESVKAVSDLYAPLTGTVVALNQTVVQRAAETDEQTDARLAALKRINADPYGDGWLLTIEMENPAEWDGLLSAADYAAQVARGL